MIEILTRIVNIACESDYAQYLLQVRASLLDKKSDLPDTYLISKIQKVTFQTGIDPYILNLAKSAPKQDDQLEDIANIHTTLYGEDCFFFERSAGNSVEIVIAQLVDSFGTESGEELAALHINLKDCKNEADVFTQIRHASASR